MKLWVVLGALNAALAQTTGAFGAHALRAKLTPERLDTWQTAARYHMYHALGLVLVGLLASQKNVPATVPGAAMQTGIVLFSGSLYALALTGIRPLGAITPIGGLAFLIGWGSLAWLAWTRF